MITLDQVFLLEQKVESAVAKIQQLQAENDALRNKCAELTNALSAKSEQLSTFENDQTQIEDGIKKALDRLNSIENSVLKAASQMNMNGQGASIRPAPAAPVQEPVAPKPAPVSMAAVTEPVPQPVAEQPVQEEPKSVVHPIFQDPVIEEEIEDDSTSLFDAAEKSFTSTPLSFDDIPTEDSFGEPPMDEDSTDGLGFDIF